MSISSSTSSSEAVSNRATVNADRAPGPRRCGLASPRDRARLRERQAAERARVERVLARGPRPDAARPRAALRGAMVRAEAHSDPATCRVCRGHDVCVDHVSDRGGAWRLAQCRRCDHRWTERAVAGFAPRVKRPLDADGAAVARAVGGT
ncbi:MAG: hypothetical protein R3F35_11585 [Myxococcota bacterium]